jgi:hypothetical protein
MKTLITHLKAACYDDGQVRIVHHTPDLLVISWPISGGITTNQRVHMEDAREAAKTIRKAIAHLAARAQAKTEATSQERNAPYLAHLPHSPAQKFLRHSEGL